MCGIAAIVSLKGLEDPASIEPMAQSLSHRGPDDAGFLFASPNGATLETAASQDLPGLEWQPIVALGFRRLSIIDLSSSGHQPMPNEDGRLWLIFNGEIYNYLELMTELKRSGHVFRSHCDSEVILHAYEEWGDQCVNHFNGMWAFAIWDINRKRLFCSRDRFGVKPLYYASAGEHFILASEPKGIIASGLLKVQPNYAYLYRFLVDSLLQDGADTFYEGIRSVLPGTCISFDQAGIREFRYWDYGDPAVRERYDFLDFEGTFRELLIDAVRIRLRSDVPLGACLSGGLDSSTIVAIVSHLVGKGCLDTFSAVFNSSKNDERSYMRYMADFCEARAHSIPVDGRDFADIVPRIVRHLDGPCLSASTYAFWKVCELARQNVKVLLDGQGADEVLGGYLGFLPPYIVSSYRSALRERSVARLLGTGAELAKAVRFAGWRQLYFLYRDYSYIGRVLKPHRKILQTEQVIHPDLRASLSTGNAQPNGHGERKFEDELTQALFESHSRTNLPGLLQYGDGISMAHSLEARLPFMDYRLVEFCFALPPDTKIRGTTTKHLLRTSMRHIVPDVVLDRKDKIGFATPFSEWIGGELRPFVMDLLTGKAVREHGVFDADVVKRVIERHVANRIDMSFYIWRWLTTELWLDQLNQERTSHNKTAAAFARAH